MSRFIQKDERAADLSEVRSDEQLDWQALETWLKTHLAEESGLNPDANMIVTDNKNFTETCYDILISKDKL